MADGVVEEVADGVLRVLVPVPFGRLGDVNCYLLHGRDGWTVVDTGINTSAARAAWQAATAATGLSSADLRQILLTHTHPDHLGLAGWLQRCAEERCESAVPVRLSAHEQALMHAWNEPASAARLYMLFVHCGVPEAHLAAITNGLERLRVLTRPHPHGLRTLRLLLIGDHVLPHITPTIGRWPSTQPDPLGRYIASLRALIDLDVRLVLPGHGYPFTRWASRLQELLAHHDIRLAHMEAAVHSGATVYDVCRHVFDLEALSLDEARFALTETLAHLDHLVQAGRLQRRGDGVWCYSRM